MSENKASKEEQILRVMKRVLTDVAKDTFTRPGFKHQLSDNTIQGIRDCLSLITVREHELIEDSGRSHDHRPRYTDEPSSNVIVQLDTSGNKGKNS
ncbi:MAG: segregation and condensation protein A [Gammaproteobacteria bacterium]|nr:segregation and condensation protein A [Gammaproteobacteria bacterium]